MFCQSMMIYIAKRRTDNDKAYTNVRGINLSEDEIECESFTVVSIDFLLVYKSKYYLEVYLNNAVIKL